ncbi:carboxylesterase family protein [Sphingomonas sp. AOB5]|uniref:carboxylesterase/lipase family protein n=1 Tax=Sphingomonas sp. AOB5 TaxID=3034017 RepID=UPI0023FA248A|nr:carboxylesterase family protein [Sphingomonas sp. AOB5]MDF7775294.1 carboxylesterase family protein [Sphingomonas sp. AOB5]
MIRTVFATALALSLTTLPGGGSASLAPPVPAPVETVRIDTGLLSGVAGRDPAIRVFKGIPYAAPPVGELRWRPPAPAKAWRGVRKADDFGNLCPQHDPRVKDMPMSEDCLTANVWTGAASAKERRPVYVWIYGGGFNEGFGANPQFDGEGLAKKGVIVVTFNYRLGPLGFLATPELSKESGHNASGNYGLMDDIALLKWVQRNIAAFGGDPKQVTIGGQSAGAGSVGFLSMSPLAKGLFHQSVAESQVRYPRDLELRYLNTSTRTMKGAETAGVAYVAARGTRSLKELRAMPWQQLMEGSGVADPDVYTGSPSRPPLFRPVVDGWIVPRTYGETLSGGTQNHVGYVAGNNKDESGAVPETAFETLRANPPINRPGMPHTSVTLSVYVNWAKTKFGPMAGEFLKLYPATNDQEAALANNDAVRDNSRVSTWMWAREWTKTVRQPVFTYFWSHALVGPTRLTRGAFHGSEIMYMFNSLDANDLPWTDEDRRIADIMSSYLANIVKRGDPNGPGLPLWPAFDASKPQVMEVGDRFAPIAIASPEKLDFWQRFFATQDAW